MRIPLVRHLDYWSLLAFLIPFTLYLWSLAPTVTFYDSGEFTTAVYFLGSAHSPGYPLFLLYAKPFTSLPFGNLAFRVNLATAVSAALVCCTAFYLILSLLKDVSFVQDDAFSQFAQRLAALSGALVLSVSPRLWLQSNHDKPYPLVALIASLVLLFLLRWRDELKHGCEQPAWWYGAAFLVGLGTGAHQTVILLVPGCLVFVLMTEPQAIRRVREWLLTGVLLLLGGAVQLYLPLRAAAEARQNWGDPSSLSRFLWHVLRRGYPEELHSRDMSLLLKQLGAFDVPHEFGWVGFVFFCAGIWATWKIQRAFLFFVLVSLGSFWLVIAGYFNPQTESVFLTEEFYTPIYLMVAVMIAIGLYFVTAWGADSAKQPEQYGASYRLLLAVLFLLIPVTQLVINLPTQDQHKNYLAHDYALNTLRPLPEEAILFTWGDSGAFPLWYLQGVERFREDLDLPHIPHLVFHWYQRELPRLAADFKGGPAGLKSEQLFTHLITQHRDGRPLLMDYSTRYSLDWHNRQPVQTGIIYWPAEVVGDSCNDLIWDEYVLHRLVPQGWHPDMDSYKALVIHAYCLLQSAEDLARHGHVDEAGRLLRITETIMPGWKESLHQMQQRYAIPRLNGGKDAD